MRSFLTISLSATCMSPAFAEDILTRPESCQLITTVQFDNCTVDYRFDCQNAAGEYYRTETADPLGVYNVWTYDPATGQGISTYFDGEVRSLKFVGDGLADALKSGRGAEQYVGEISVFGMRKPLSGVTTFEYKGETTDIGGLSFQKVATEDSAVLPFPMEKEAARSVLLNNDAEDLVLTQEVTYLNADGSVGSTLRMVEFFLPGQAGFGEEPPRFGCDQLSALPPSPSIASPA